MDVLNIKLVPIKLSPLIVQGPTSTVSPPDVTALEYPRLMFTTDPCAIGL